MKEKSNDDGKKAGMIQAAAIQCLRDLVTNSPHNAKRLACSKEQIQSILDTMASLSKNIHATDDIRDGISTSFHICEILDSLLELKDKKVGDAILDADGLVLVSQVMTKYRYNKGFVEKSKATQEALFRFM
mmetsp:Transcript_25904/g.54015  ORF Transcript_25904/g.54015 Transcript_25904/m.54015 type:complete len:131 (+) Transcript_25904:30-422(+)